MNQQSKRFGTLLIHNGYETDPVTGALGVPVVQTSTFAQQDIDAGQEFDYARSGNPTRKALEETIAALEGGAKGYAFGSGMAATSSALGIGGQRRRCDRPRQHQKSAAA